MARFDRRETLDSHALAAIGEGRFQRTFAMITRIQPGARMSEAVVHGDTVYLAGQVGEPGDDVIAQTRTALAEVEALLAEAGSDKSKILMAQIWLADMADFDAMNSVWDAWVDTANPPARATGESRLASPDYKVEVIVIAAKA